jgi:hypothetical protein
VDGAGLGVLVDVVRRREQLLGLGDGRVKLEPGLAGGEAHALGVDARAGEPVRDGRDGRVARRERARDLGRRPVLAVVGRVRVGDVEEELLEALEVRLREPEAEREDRGAVVLPDLCNAYVSSRCGIRCEGGACGRTLDQPDGGAARRSWTTAGERRGVASASVTNDARTDAANMAGDVGTGGWAEGCPLGVVCVETFIACA